MCVEGGNPPVEPAGTVPPGHPGAHGQATGVGYPGEPGLRDFVHEAERSTARAVCFSDVHGNLSELEYLWAMVKRQLGEEQDTATLIFLGDYCDRGPDTRGVLDFLITLKASRPGATHFLAGNHDFGFAAFIGELPIPAGPPPLDLDGTKNPKFTSGYWAHPVPGGMHYQGRRWGEGRVYNTHSTFASYGVAYDAEPETREALIRAVPAEHKAFIRKLAWVHDETFVWGRLVCVHAGLDSRSPVNPQLEALAARDLSASCLHSRVGSSQDFARSDGTPDQGRLAALCDRASAEPMHPELFGRAVLISGHHGFTRLDGDRIILDASGGRPADGRPLEAILLPNRIVMGSDGSVQDRRPDAPPPKPRPTDAITHTALAMQIRNCFPNHFGDGPDKDD